MSITIGIDILAASGLRALRGKRVGLLSHEAALTASGATSARLLHSLPGVTLAALFGPEHGYFGRGGAGEATPTLTHPDWGIPVYSLYGQTRRPTPEMLRGLDLVICDLRDLGIRCYTYLATLKLMLEACAEARLPVIVADRPVPLPYLPDGPVAEPDLFSFVAPAAVPLSTGLTPGEAARFLADGIAGLDLRVAAIRGWKRRDSARAWDLPPDWYPPSPAIRCRETALTYPALVFAEALPALDVARATPLAFRAFGAPWIDGPASADALEALGLSGVTFHPCRYVAANAPYAGIELPGVRLSVTDPRRYRPALTSLAIIEVLSKLQGAERLWSGARPEWFDKLYGTRSTREALQAGVPFRDIADFWRPALARYARLRRNALLY